MLRRRADDRVVGATGLQVRSEELDAAEQGVERAAALEIRVDVDAAEAPQGLEPQDVRPLCRYAQPFVDLDATQIVREVVLGPELEPPVRVVLAPRLAV